MLPTHVMALAYKGHDTMPTWFVIIVVVRALARLYRVSKVWEWSEPSTLSLLARS